MTTDSDFDTPAQFRNFWAAVVCGAYASAETERAGRAATHPRWKIALLVPTFMISSAQSLSRGELYFQSNDSGSATVTLTPPPSSAAASVLRTAGHGSCILVLLVPAIVGLLAILLWPSSAGIAIAMAGLGLSGALVLITAIATFCTLILVLRNRGKGVPLVIGKKVITPHWTIVGAAMRPKYVTRNRQDLNQRPKRAGSSEDRINGFDFVLQTVNAVIPVGDRVATIARTEKLQKIYKRVLTEHTDNPYILHGYSPLRNPWA
jgi:hypothetical protein